MADSFADVNESRSRREPLRAELRPYLAKTRIGWFIRHPFANEMIPDMNRCAWLHQMIDERTAKADSCFEAQDWEGYINCIEIYSQPEWLAKDAHLLPDDRYWPLLRQVHGAQRSTHKRRELFDDLFRADRPGRENLMEPDERALLARLPDVLTVYRGYADDDDNDDEGFEDGIAWTLDRRAAVWYANRFCASDNPRLVIGRIRKADIWAFCRNGDLLLPPEMVFIRRDRRVWSNKARTNWNAYITKPFDVEAYIRKP